MSFLIFSQIFFVCLLGAMSPGPSMVVVINNAVFKNRYHGILTSIGHGVGITIYATFAVIGIGLIIKTNLFFFYGIKFLSVIFLIYLGIRSIINVNQINFNQKKEIRGSVTSFFEGFSISILNPKIFIWFMAIYSQFMSINNDFFFNITLILIAGIVDACWYIILTFISTSKASLRFIKTKYFVLRKLVGYIFIGIGLLLLFDIFLKQLA